MPHDQDTIAAISTAPGEAAIAIIRISGKNTGQIIGNIIGNIIGLNKPNIQHRAPALFWIIDPSNGGRIDEAVITLYKAPKSYTGEDTAEISCHGNPLLTKRILEIIVDQGAQIAEKGEFTKRAFLNGKIDLIKAESVIDLIKAKTYKGINKAAERMYGDLSSKMLEIRRSLMKTLCSIEAEIDFPEDVEEPKYGSMKLEINKIILGIRSILKNERESKFIEEGTKIAIIGKPNVGKSTLMNVLLRKDRVIVTDIPGTTTDTIEDQININGFAIRLIDTAGIREGGNKIELEGRKKTKQAIGKADLLMIVFDASKHLENEDYRIIKRFKSRNVLAILNKCDRKMKIDKEKLSGFKTKIEISALKKIGIEKLEETLAESLGGGDISEKSEIFANIRQCSCLKRVLASLQKVNEALVHRLPGDLITIDLRDAIEGLGIITGQNISDEIIGKIFERFCIGK